MQRSYISVGNDAIDYAKSHVVHVGTAPINNRSAALKQARINHAMRNHLFSCEETVFDMYSIPNSCAMRRIKRAVKLAKRYQSAHCGELSRLVLNYLRKKNIPAELFNIPNGDHTFIVIGRDPKSDPNQPLKWGKDAVICDPLQGICFPSTEIYKYLKCHKVDLKKKKINVYYKYTNEPLVPVYTIPNTTDYALQTKMFVQSLEHLQLITSVCEKVLPDKQKSLVMEELIVIKQEVIDLVRIKKEYTDNDLARVLNKKIKCGLKAIQKNLSSDLRSAVMTQLIDAMIGYKKNSQDFMDQSEFALSIIYPEAGRFSKDICDKVCRAFKLKTR